MHLSINDIAAEPKVEITDYKKEGGVYAFLMVRRVCWGGEERKGEEGPTPVQHNLTLLSWQACCSSLCVCFIVVRAQVDPDMPTPNKPEYK